jgi:hypothetical protein
MTAMKRGLSSVWYAAAAALLGVIVTFLSVLVADQTAIPKETLGKLCLWGAVVSGILLIALFFLAIGNDFWEKKQEAEAAIANLDERRLSAAVVPQFIRMTERIDTFTLLDDLKSIRLGWYFRIDTDLLSPLADIFFPINADIYQSEADYVGNKSSVISVESVKVNGEEQGGTAAYSPLRLSRSHPLASLAPLGEHGILKVRVNLSQGRQVGLEITISMLIQDAFQKSLEKEFVIVDIPFLTESLEVSVNAPRGYKVVRASPFTLQATAREMYEMDEEETTQQNKLLTVDKTSLVWRCGITTKPPKLGYRYLLYYKVIKDAA